MEKKKVRFISITSVLILISLFFITLSYIKITSPQDRVSTGSTNSMSELQYGLTTSNTLGDNHLTPKRLAKLKIINDKILKNEFIGGYLKIRNNSIEFSGSRGFANAADTVAFKLDSTFYTGRYQNLIDNAIILRLVSQNRINLSDKIQKYIPTIKNISVRQVLLSQKNVYCRSTDLNKLKNGSIPLNQLKFTTIKKNHYRLANDIFKEFLLSKILKTSYSNVINRELVAAYNLSNTRIHASKSDDLANDVKSYKYKVSGNLPVQSDMLKISSNYADNDLRMSIEDIAYSYYKIMNGDYFSTKYARLFRKSLPEYTTKISDDRELYFLTSEYNQTLSLVFKNKSVLLVVSNFPNKKLSDYQLVELLNKLM